MKFGILVNEGPYTHEASDTAFQFVKAALAKGHEIYRVFFYHDGVNNGTRLTVPPQDDRNIVKRWSELAAKHKLDLVLCIAAAYTPSSISSTAAPCRANFRQVSRDRLSNGDLLTVCSIFLILKSSGSRPALP